MASDERAAVLDDEMIVCIQVFSTQLIPLRELRAQLAAQGLHAVTDAEMAVLKAMGKVHHDVLRVVRRYFGVRFPAMGELIDAELARRESTK